MKSWTLSEWAYLRYGDGPDEIPHAAADALAAAARTSAHARASGEGVLEHGRHRLRAKNVVGVVAAQGLSLEILPKIEGIGDPDVEAGRGEIRKRLVHMLAAALDIDVAAGRITTLGWQRDHLLEILIRLFADKLVDAVRAGMPRRYVPHDDDLTALRGRLDLIRQFTVRAASPEKLACRFDEFSPDILLNRVMKTAVMRLRRLTRRAETQRRLAELAFIYADISPLAGRWDRRDIALDRTNARWRELLDLACLLLGERYQTTSLGGGQGFSLLFDMNVLFEAYVAAMLRRALAGSGVEVVSQGGRLFCLEEVRDDGSAGAKRFQTRPDILLKRAGETVAVIDTKWKRLSSWSDDPKHGVSQADIYQMVAYGRLYRCDQLLLLYPHHSALGGCEGHQARFKVTGSDHALSFATYDIAHDKLSANRLKNLIGMGVLETAMAAKRLAAG